MNDNQGFALVVFATGLVILVVVAWAVIRQNNGF